MTPNNRTAILTIGIVLVAIPGVAAAQTTGAGGMQPLIDLLNNIAELLTYLGVALATVGIIIAGILYMLPGPETTLRAKQVFSNVLVGLVIIGFATLIVNWIAVQLPGITA